MAEPEIAMRVDRHKQAVADPVAAVDAPEQHHPAFEVLVPTDRWPPVVALVTLRDGPAAILPSNPEARDRCASRVPRRVEAAAVPTPSCTVGFVKAIKWDAGNTDTLSLRFNMAVPRLGRPRTRIGVLPVEGVAVLPVCDGARVTDPAREAIVAIDREPNHPLVAIFNQDAAILPCGAAVDRAHDADSGHRLQGFVALEPGWPIRIPKAVAGRRIERQRLRVILVVNSA